jgi:CMP-N,N'-diacetyllegionaminic acid synthase
MKIIITICARGGSKGIPGKNIKVINGIPLIAYSIDLAVQFRKKYNALIALSTDDIEIKKIVESYGITTLYQRPIYLATDVAGKIDTIKDVLLYEESLSNEKFDYLLDLDITSPLRTFEDIEQALFLLINRPEAYNIFSVNPASRNPYFNMVEENDNGFYSLVKTNSGASVMTRQSAPKVFDMNASFYWYRRSFFDLGIKTAITEKSMIYEMHHICFDLDHPVDFLFMEYLLQNNKLDFKL